MAWILKAFLIAWPLAELILFSAVAQRIGLAFAILLLLLAAGLGVLLLRLGGLSTALGARAAMERGEMPLGPLFDGACFAVAGLLLILPGFISDFFALLLLLPFVRGGLRRGLARRFRPMTPPGSDSKPMDADIIDAEWYVVEETEPRQTPENAPKLPSPGCAKPSSVIATDPPQPGANDER